MKEGYTLITGASHGIGREMARTCAKQGMNLLLVALPDQHLTDTVREIEDTYAVKVDHFGVNLCELDAAQQIYDWTQEKGYEVHNLINNAGLGAGGYFEDVPLQKTVNLILLNNMASVSLTHLFLPHMKARGFGHIMGTSSIEGILIMPYKATYSATKRFLYSFYLSLRTECRDAGVGVSVLCPGPVPTSEDVKKRIAMHGKKSVLLVRSVEEVGEAAVRGMLNNEGIIIPGRMLRTLVMASWLFPFRLKMWLAERFSRKYAKKKRPVQQEQLAV